MNKTLSPMPSPLCLTLQSGALSAQVMNYGCTITNLFVPGRDGRKVDVLLGYDSFEEWKAGTEAHDAIVGRVANRIAGGKFTLDGVEYLLDVNNGPNCLHGGKKRFEKMFWDVVDSTENSVHFRRVSQDMEQGFPGNVTIDVFYTLTEDSLVLEYKATTDKATPVNLTNHAYFNLAGKGNVLDHVMQLDCDKVLEINDVMIPTGKYVDVTGTEFDFRTEKTVGLDIHRISEKIGGGYDHCFVTKACEKGLERFGKITSDQTGISMEIFTNQRGVQVYTGNFLGGIKGKNGVVHQKYDGICFETQRFPDCINHPDFPDCVLRPGEEYVSKTVYKFKTQE